MTIVRLTHGDTDELAHYQDLVGEFMETIFGLSPGQYYIADDTELSDLHLRCPDVINKIHRTYGIKPTLDTRIVRVLEALRVARSMPRH